MSIASSRRMRCEEVMKSNVHCVSPDDTAAAAAAKMRSCDCGFLPVCDQERHVVGW